jgi:hypothetical protein
MTQAEKETIETFCRELSLALSRITGCKIEITSQVSPVEAREPGSSSDNLKCTFKYANRFIFRNRLIADKTADKRPKNRDSDGKKQLVGTKCGGSTLRYPHLWW